MSWTAIRNVRALPGGGCVCEIDIDLGKGPETLDYVARPGGGGLSDALLAAVARREHAGPVTAWAPDPASLRAEASARVRAALGALAGAFTRGVPPAEVHGWALKAAAAGRIAAGAPAAGDAEMIAAEAALTGEDPAALAAAILARAAAHHRGLAVMSGVRRAADAAIAAAETPEAIAAAADEAEARVAAFLASLES